MKSRNHLLVIALILIALAMILLAYATHADAAPASTSAGASTGGPPVTCARPVTENGQVTYVGAAIGRYGRFVLGIGTDTGHKFAFYTWRAIRVGRRVVVRGCLDETGRVLDNVQWLR